MDACLCKDHLVVFTERDSALACMQLRTLLNAIRILLINFTDSCSYGILSKKY
jgi:hypothetical protein